MTHSVAEYEAYEEWLSDNISSSELEDAIMREVGEEGGRPSESQELRGIRAVFEKLEKKEESRLKAQGKAWTDRSGGTRTRAETITTYFDRVIAQGRGPSTGAIVQKIESVTDQVVERRRREFASRLLKERGTVEEKLDKARQSGLFPSTAALETELRDAEEEKLVAAASEQRLRQEEAQRAEEEQQNELLQLFRQNIEQATTAKDLSYDVWRNMERKIKNPATRSRLRQEYLAKKAEIAPERMTYWTAAEAERLRNIPLSLAGERRVDELRKHAEDYLTRVFELAGEDEQTMKRSVKHFDRNTLYQMGLKKDEVSAVYNHYHKPRPKATESEEAAEQAE